MVCSIPSLGLHGVSGYPVTAECDLSGGLPAFTIVGLADAAVTEARERVRSAIKNCGFAFPVSRITVNLAPARVRKEGTLYDLPILLGILAAAEEIRPLPEDAAFLGELSLSGALRPVTGVLPMALAAAADGIRSLYVPAENAAEAAEACGDAMQVYPARTAREVVDALRGLVPLSPAAPIQSQADRVEKAAEEIDDNVQRLLAQAMQEATAANQAQQAQEGEPTGQDQPEPDQAYLSDPAEFYPVSAQPQQEEQSQEEDDMLSARRDGRIDFGSLQFGRDYEIK